MGALHDWRNALPCSAFHRVGLPCPDVRQKPARISHFIRRLLPRCRSERGAERQSEEAQDVAPQVVEMEALVVFRYSLPILEGA